MPCGQLPRQNRRIPAESRYAIRSALYRIFALIFSLHGGHLTSARPIRSKRAHAQVAELVDALASGASGLTAVKVRVLSWAPHFSSSDSLRWRKARSRASR